MWVKFCAGFFGDWIIEGRQSVGAVVKLSAQSEGNTLVTMIYGHGKVMNHLLSWEHVSGRRWIWDMLNPKTFEIRQ